MSTFMSCDWGTSMLRLRLVDALKMVALLEVKDDKGITGVFKLWKQKGMQDDGRLYFYQSFLAGYIRMLEQQAGYSLQDIPMIISGMASSSIGMMELPYKEAPFKIDGQDLFIKAIEATNDFNHSMLMISGVKTENDAMRGEETQLIGCLNSDVDASGLFIFPGTHSKHVTVKNGEATDIKTYMTGEFFELLSKKSILSDNLEENKEILTGNLLKSFENGIADSKVSNLLHSSFMVRTNQLFGKLTKKENYAYLSGLMIGSELKDVNNNIPITIIGDEMMIKLYKVALQKTGITSIYNLDAGEAVIYGHYKIYSLYKSKLISGNNFIKK